ncbi:MAG: replication-associated recombination protein A [bacterium]|nr:replication-associated recombination protein A [bacterium]
MANKMFSFFDDMNFLKLKRPLAYRQRPTSLLDFKGQKHLLADGKVLRKMIVSKDLVNMIFYGPSGTGKTSLVDIISRFTSLPISHVNATTSGISDIKKILLKAKEINECHSQNMLVMIDEIHRFNKMQQDVLLPAMEDGSIILLGLTTENPHYYVNNALLSRSMVFEFKKLEKVDVIAILANATRQLASEVEKEVFEFISDFVDGDARYALNLLEMALKAVDLPITVTKLKHTFGDKLRANVKYDKKADYHYDIISAFIKSMRGSDPDATLYWLALMLSGGEDPRFIARRIAIAAAEDVGMAAPEILAVVDSAWNLVEKVGMPEARIILAEAAIAVASAPKSNSVYLGINTAMQDVGNGNIIAVPRHVSDNAKDYLSPHNEDGHFLRQDYGLGEYKERYYKPSNQGREKKYQEYLNNLWDIK